MSETRTAADLFGDVDPNGDVWTREANTQRAREALSRYGSSAKVAWPASTAERHHAEHGHLLAAGCCARTDGPAQALPETKMSIETGGRPWLPS